ncbi:hypothetical protein HYT45_04790 [Candidatus Uhrbacteria bacterium]|nr:hypothetical protein [Candidatus Uhrbacteria bacterium]
MRLLLKPPAQPEKCGRYGRTLRTREVDGTLGVGVKSVDIQGNTKGEGSLLARS